MRYIMIAASLMATALATTVHADDAGKTGVRPELLATVSGTGAVPLSASEMRNIRGAATLTISVFRGKRTVAVPDALFLVLDGIGRFPASDDGGVIVSDPGVGIIVSG